MEKLRAWDEDCGLRAAGCGLTEGFGSLAGWPSARLRVKSAEKCIAYKAAKSENETWTEDEAKAELETPKDAAKANKQLREQQVEGI